MRECTCTKPVENINPRSGGRCVKCSGRLSTEWASNNETVGHFFDRLAEGIFPAGELYSEKGPPDWWLDFRQHCEIRELMGRDKFGFEYLRRDNAREAMEEAADLALYMMLALLRARRDGDPEEWSIALTAAKHAAEAHRYSTALRAHRHQQFSDYES